LVSLRYGVTGNPVPGAADPLEKNQVDFFLHGDLEEFEIVAQGDQDIDADDAAGKFLACLISRRKSPFIRFLEMRVEIGFEHADPCRGDDAYPSFVGNR
jgi:hypothetical protein